MKIPFSQRYGYVTPESILIRENLSGPILNSTYNFLVRLQDDRYFDFLSDNIRDELWFNKLNLRYGECGPELEDIITNEAIAWYTRIDLIEWLIIFIRNQLSDEQYGFSPLFYIDCNNDLDRNIAWLNSEYERHNYAYRIINDIFVETTSSSELSVIQETLNIADTNTLTHLQECLRLLSPSNQGLSTRNAIKEAISAVEVTARQITRTNTLDIAFKKLRDIHPMIRNSMEMLYHYTNQKNTGIRHGWMEQSEEPTINEAIFVLVTSCSFINYLTKVYCNN